MSWKWKINNGKIGNIVQHKQTSKQNIDTITGGSENNPTIWLLCAKNT